MNDLDAYRHFYELVDRDQVYNSQGWKLESQLNILRYFVDKYHPKHGHILEIGAGRGDFQDIAENYTGADISETLRRYFRKDKRYVVVKDGDPYPFQDDCFDSAFTFATFEHIPSIEATLEELVRVMKPGGYILFHAAWQVRPWTSKVHLLRPYRELPFIHRLEKFSTIIRETVLWRSFFVFPERMIRTVRFMVWKREKNDSWHLDYKKLNPYYESFIQADCDACNHIDMHAVVVWFMSRGCEITDHFTLNKGRTGGDVSLWKAFFLRTGCFVVRVPQK